MVNGQWSIVPGVLHSLINGVAVCSSARPLNQGELELSADNVGTNNDLVGHDRAVEWDCLQRFIG